jgi:hypothetical protein
MGRNSLILRIWEAQQREIIARNWRSQQGWHCAKRSDKNRLLIKQFQKCRTTSMETTYARQLNDCYLSETRFAERANAIPVFLFFTCARNNSSDCGKRFIPSMIQRTLKFTLVWDGYQCTRSHPISDSDPCSLGLIADARVTKAAHHTPESANQICFPPSCSVLPSHTPAHWLHRCMCTLWYPESMHTLGTCASVNLSRAWGHGCCEIRTPFSISNYSLIWCDWCPLKTSCTRVRLWFSKNQFSLWVLFLMRSIHCTAITCAYFDFPFFIPLIEPSTAYLHELPGTLSWTHG